MRTFRWFWLGILTVLALCVIWALLGSPYSALYWWTAPRTIVNVLVPRGFEGVGLIAYQVLDGEVASRAGDTWIYRLGDDGALLLQNDPPAGAANMTFYFTEEQGELTPILPTSCFDHASPTEVPVVCIGGTYGIYRSQELRPHQIFRITRNPDRSSWSRGSTEALLDRYFDQLIADE